MAMKLNNDNPPHELTVEEQRAGGIASGEARNKKKEQIELLKKLLEVPTKNGKTYGENITLGLIKGAMQGKAENYKTIMDYIDDTIQSNETPIVQINIVDNSNLEKVMYEEN